MRPLLWGVPLTLHPNQAQRLHSRRPPLKTQTPAALLSLATRPLHADKNDLLCRISSWASSLHVCPSSSPLDRAVTPTQTRALDLSLLVSPSSAPERFPNPRTREFSGCPGLCCGYTQGHVTLGSCPLSYTTSCRPLQILRDARTLSASGLSSLLFLCPAESRAQLYGHFQDAASPDHSGQSKPARPPRGWLRVPSYRLIFVCLWSSLEGCALPMTGLTESGLPDQGLRPSWPWAQSQSLPRTGT